MEPGSPTLRDGALFEGRYEIRGELGSGRFSRVYRARQVSTGQSVAIKLLDARGEGAAASAGDETERLRREARICAELSHTNIVPLVDSGETPEGRLYVVFGYVPGETLRQALGREGALPVRESLRVMTQVLDALTHAHAKGIVHRDLKPENIMLSGHAPRRNALVLDFGLGGVVEGRRRREWESLTQSRQFLGTPLYAAPEQLAGEPPTERSDLYAWGLVFLHCLTGRQPFAEGAAARLLDGGGAVEIPEWLEGHRLGALLRTVTAREPAKRDLTSEDLFEALEEIARGEHPVAPEASSTPAPLASEGERRHMTVMFCDLARSTALSRELDAERYRELVRAYQQRGAEAVERYGGHVVQYLGDGLLAYFGYPQAHEDDAERAIRAARELLRGLEVLSARSEAQHGVRIRARVGIHTGPVVVGEMGGGEKKERLALGDTPNIAARLDQVAEPGTVVVSDATLRLVAGLFVTEALGTRQLPGVEEPIGVHRVLHPSGVRSRLERASGLSPFVGRGRELGLLLDGFEQAQEGRGQAVLVAGEPGIGKSRLLHELRERLREEPHTWLECRTSPYTQSSALYPLIEMLEGGLDFREEQGAEEKLATLERALAHVGIEPEASVPLLASLLSLRLPERYAPLEMSPQLQRQRTLETLLAWVLALGEKQPVVLGVEDLHWSDPSTLEWLGLLIAQCPTARVLVLATHRPDFEPPWPGREHVLPVRLGRLRGREVRELVAGSAADLPGDLVEQLARRSDGVPLFAEELARGIAEAGHGAQGIPETLQDSLAARLDRLGEAREVAQLGSAIGREFEHGLLETVAPLPPDALREGLGRLVETELVYQRGLPPAATYTFKHALVQDTAYQSLLDGQRRELHGRIASALEERFPERAAREPELVARHCEEAGRAEQAIAHYERAAEQATRRWAQAEAIGHRRRALALLDTLGDTPERRERELQLQIALGTSMFSAKGGGDPEAERAYARARELCDEARDSPALLRALLGLSVFHFSRGEHRISCELGERALALAERGGEVYPRVVAHTRLGIARMWRGELTRGHEHLERAVSLHQPEEHRALAAAWGQDWGTTARSFAATARQARGHQERARRLLDETITLAREGDPYSLSFALAVAASLHQLLDERDRARERAEEALAIARRHGFPTVSSIAGSVRGWAVGGSRAIEEIRTIIDQAVIAVRTTIPDYYRLLARVCLEAGRLEEAEAAVQAGVDTLGESRTYESLLHRVRGEILLRQGSPDAAESAFRRALGVAREQAHKLHELKAATSLARLLRDRGERDAARDLLRPVYEAFTEGLDTRPLVDAKALLDELG